MKSLDEAMTLHRKDGYLRGSGEGHQGASQEQNKLRASLSGRAESSGELPFQP